MVFVLAVMSNLTGLADRRRGEMICKLELGILLVV